MKRKILVLSFAFALFLISSITGVSLFDSVAGEGGIVYFPPVPQIIINSNGTITPQTDLISRKGVTYTLTKDINGTQIVIECSNIVFDGNGHSINLTNSGSNPGIHISYSVNTTIKNVQVNTPISARIAMYDCSDCRITGVKSSGYIELRQSSYNVICENISPLFLKSDYNQIFKNNITGLALWAGSNVFYQNNILLDSGYTPYADEANFWDNGSIGNYWSDYVTRYPNASEVGQTGIGDTPYIPYSDNIDHYPLTNPVDINAQPPTSTPTATPFLPPRSPPHLDPIFYLLPISIIGCCYCAVCFTF